MNMENNNAKYKIGIFGIGRNFSNEHRIRNEIQALKENNVIEGFGEDKVDSVDNFHYVKKPSKYIYRIVKIVGGLIPWLRIKFEIIWYRNLIKSTRNRNYDLLIPHNIVDGLIAVKSGVKFAFHSHEYLPRQFDGSIIFRILEIRYRNKALKYIFKHAELIVVEGEKVMNEYIKHYGISKYKLHIMPSMPSYHKNLDKYDNDSGKIKLIHHGIIVPERKIEMLLEIAGKLGRNYQLTIMGPGPEEYLKKLEYLAKLYGNITIKSPVNYDDIVKTIANNDLGLIIFGSPHYHHKFMTVPNKFWECFQARVPVLVNINSAMAKYVSESQCGIVSSGNKIQDYVDTISKLDKNVLMQMKINCENKSWVHSRDSWLSKYNDKLSSCIGV